MLRTFVLPATIGLLAFATAQAGQSNHEAGAGAPGISASWNVKRLQVGSRKKARRGNKAVRKTKTRTSTRQQNFAVPGGFRLRRGGFNDDHSPGR